MKNRTHIHEWAEGVLADKGYALEKSPETVVETPWSKVVRFSTAKEDFYLKQTPADLFIEANIIQVLRQLTAGVAEVIASNKNLNCFLMRDAGVPLRQYLKTAFKPALLFRTLEHYTAIQRLAEEHTTSLLSLGVPDWRLHRLPEVFDQLTGESAFLKSEGITDHELALLRQITPKITEQCRSLARYGVTETLVQPDFNTNNTLYNPATEKMTLIDVGEIVITHPFFSLDNFLLQSIIHHGLTKKDPLYHALHQAYCDSWPFLITKNQLPNVLSLVQKLLPVYAALSHHRLVSCVDSKAFRAYYSDKPSRFAGYLRELIASQALM